MPLIVWAYLGFVSGLLAGFSRSWVLIYGVVGCVVSAGVWRGFREVLEVGLLLGVGVLLALSLPVPAMGKGVPPAHSDPATFLGRQRMRAERTIDTVFQQDAPIAKALLVADKTQLSKEVKQRYVAAGIAHRLSISGLHVALIAAVVELIFRLLRLPRRIAAAAAVGVMGVYIAVIGFPLSAVRAGLMFTVAGLSRLLQRPTSPWAILAGCGFVPLLDPTTVLTVGYQLNMVGMAGFIAGSALARRVVRPRFVGWRRALARSFLVSLVATAVTLPLVAWWFGQVSLIAPVTNLLVEPLFGVLQPLLFLGMLFAPWQAASGFLADAVHPLLVAVDMIAAFAAGIPYASLAVRPALLEGVLAGVASVAIVVACISRFPARATLLASAAVCALAWIG
ncbi:MAG TPA: ComEC/Rec2 family competence protein [Gemmatimonadaceae bacterium]|nr:ComEC/Rec2 family competence protein [Gemmatimonadaceae bacterium]